MVVELVLDRDYRNAKLTLGTVTNGIRTLQTLERPWVPSPLGICGAKGISCVPAGRYRLERHNSDGHPNVWALVNHALGVYHWDEDVPPTVALSRTCVLIHSANWPEELRGCIAPGTERSGKAGVANSKDAVNQIRTWIGGSFDTWITIKEEKLGK